MSRKTKLRIVYAFITIILLAVEVMIALFVRDRFIRPYFGDMLVVVVIYTFVRIFIPEKYRLLPLFVFIFSAAVEILQYFEIVQKLGLGGNIFLRTLLGSTFDLKDIACYAVGCAALGIYDILRYIKSNKNKTER